MVWTFTAAMFLTLGQSSALAAARPNEPPVELGEVPWLRDYDLGLKQVNLFGKPMLLQFQEIPGCKTCQDFGAGPLRHPLVLDAAREFVPVAIANNLKGADKVVLERFKEPAWNNPVTRFLDASERDLIAREDRAWSTGRLLARMRQALVAAGRPVPENLRVVAFEHSPRARQKVVFAMHSQP